MSPYLQVPPQTIYGGTLIVSLNPSEKRMPRQGESAAEMYKDVPPEKCFEIWRGICYNRYCIIIRGRCLCGCADKVQIYE